MIRANHTYNILFRYNDTNGVAVSGAAGSMSACTSLDGGAAVATTNAVVEPFYTQAPGIYKITLTAAETNGEFIAWFVKDVAGVIIAFGAEQAYTDPLVDDEAAFLNSVADAVLRRSVALAEASTDGDTVSLNSLLGAVLIHINGQQIQCNSTQTECYLPIKTLGGSLLGSIPLRVVNGNIVGDCGCV